MSEKDPTQSSPSPSRTKDDPPRRAVRSFVLRQGRETVAQQRAMAELWPRYGIEFTHLPLNLDQAFGRRAPRMIEIGFGAGEALLEYASNHPEQGCLGLEVHRPGVGHLLLGIEAANLTNLRIISHDAVEVLQQLPASSISIVHIFFPDPWPKKRHHKRRIIQPAFASLLAHVLTQGGVLRLATDWEHYAHHMRETLDACTSFENVAGSAGFVERTAVRPLTRFERRGQRLGHGVWDLEYRRR